MGKIECVYSSPTTPRANASASTLPDFDDLKLQHNPNSTQYGVATIKIWPPIHAQFVRIRPWKWRNHVALRMELFGGNEQLESGHVQVAKLVTAKTVCPQFKKHLLVKMAGRSTDCKAIQIDCRHIIQTAMTLCGCTTYSMVDVNDTNSLLYV